MDIFVYVDKAYGNNTIIDTMIPKVKNLMEIETNWLKSIYGKDNQEKVPANTPEPLGKLMSVKVFIDASHVGEKLTYCSHAGIRVYVNNTLIDWFSKIKNIVETSAFGAELIAAWIPMEQVKTLHTKFRWLGIPIDVTTLMFCNNESVVKSTSRVESKLSKKHQLIFWHSVREAI